MKRIYNAVSVAPGDGGFSVMLDGRELHSPGRRLLTWRQRALAEEVADEWRRQGETIEPATMPMMSLSATAIDRVAPRREAVIGTIAAYAGSDLLCYRAEQPADLVALQTRTWQPLLDWCAEAFGAVLAVTTGVVPLIQSDGALAALRGAVSLRDDYELTVLNELAAGSGSLVIALAIVDGRVSVDEGIAAAMLDETWQVSRWGEDEDARRRRDAIGCDMRAAGRFLQYCRVLN